MSQKTQPVYEFGGTGCLMHLALANGFPPQTYTPLVQPFTQRCRVLCLPPRALWGQEMPPLRRVNWRQSVAQDLMEGLRQYNLSGIVAIGHSFGGIATLLAALTEPERFKAIILLDPTVLPQRVMWMIRAARFAGIKRGNVLADRADKRRDVFESVDAAYTFFKTKRLFADWPDNTVRLYAESMLPTREGGVTLAWPRVWEAHYFRSLYTGTWGDLPGLRRINVPLLMVRGEHSDTLLPQTAARIRRMLPQMTYAEIAGHGHLFPQSAPDETRRVIENWLQALAF